MSFVVIIPARYESSRLPGKPLKLIAGVSMIQRVWQQACKSQASRVIIATNDVRIETAASGFGAEVCMTRSDHESGTDRLQEVVGKLRFSDDQLVVNVQGDEPLIPPEVINQVAGNLASNPVAGVATLCEPIFEKSALYNSNVVKVISRADGMAHYFSRAPIPYRRDELPDSPIEAHRHIGIYAYRVRELNSFITWSSAPTERIESLEQLRFLYNQVSIHVDNAVAEVPAGVDTWEDLLAVEKLLCDQAKNK
ncbi:MAG: 3-deoxy-manno-octulosonate cytidylyltransferase [Porticoccaceae bacterium]|nr:3-deoxy-manno-octulosonate cytidylyltransferase [Porticoccaceae bacterium]MDG1475060.1 3-deoxy-manno-octulosonate cytidylyltransferase [Porticoccaceae bacterium]